MTSDSSADNSRSGSAVAEPAAMSVRGAAVWAMAGQYLGFAVQFASSVIISRWFLGPADLGLYSIALAFALVIAVVQDFGMARHIAALPTLDRADLARCGSVSLLFALALATAIALAALPAARLYHLPGLAPIMLIIAASYLFSPLAVMPLAVMSRTMGYHGHFVVNLGGAVVQAGVAIGLAWHGWGALSLAWATLAGAAARGVIAQTLRPTLPWPLRFDGLGPILGSGSRLSLITVVGALGARMPDMVVGRFLPLGAVGLFSRGIGLSDQFRMLIAGAVGQVFFPAFARIRDRGEPLGPAYLRVVAGYTALLWPGMAGLALAARPIVRVLYGPAWAGVAPVLTMVALLEVVLCALPLHLDLPVLMGRAGRLVVRNVIDTVASVGLLVAGCQWGLNGAAASRLVYAAVWVLLYARLMDDVVRFDRRALLMVYAKSACVSIAALAPLALVYALWRAPDAVDAPVLLLAAVVGGVAWLVALRLVRHPALVDIIAIVQHVVPLPRWLVPAAICA
ncbi:oligosaccharide flippase family protein [Novosphingobium sp.]|uniref:oligosaccharide flippase family protein n=1 Tax=Novosphingobium sp. TaxID=1874826 RepID=UPI003341CD86